MARARLITTLTAGILSWEIAFSDCISMQMADDAHPAAKVGAAALDVVTAPVQLPIWIVGLIVISQMQYQEIDQNLQALAEDSTRFEADYVNAPTLDNITGLTAYNHILQIRDLPPELAGRYARHPSPWIARAVLDRG